MTCPSSRREGREALSSRLRGDRGSVAASIIILPVVIIAILLAIHFGLVLHGRNVAAAAAQDGLRAAQLDGATAGNGREAAYATLALFPNIEAASVSVTKGRDEVHVRISGEVRTPLNGLFNTFDIDLEGPVERFYFESERR